MDFEIVGEITQIEPIALGRAIRGLARLRKQYGKGRWRKLKGVGSVRLEDGTLHTAELHWEEGVQTEISADGLVMIKRRKLELQFVVCIDNKGYKASLEIGKLYRVIADEEAATRGYLRVIDESGEDYGYSANRFFPIELPQELEKALQLAS